MTYCLAMRLHEGLVFLSDEFRIAADSRILAELQTTWERRLRESFAELPSFDLASLSA